MQANPVTQANPVLFQATPTLVGNQVKWKLCHMNPPSGTSPICGESNGNYPDVDLGMNKGAYVFKFKIVNDNTGKEIKFADDNPVVKKGDPGGGKKQIDMPNGKGTDELTFVDWNSLPDANNPDPVVISYGLNFVDKTKKAVTSIDPDITNGGNPGVIEPPPGVGPGGGGGYSQSEYITAAAIALLVGVLIGFFVHKLFFAPRPVG
jgi:hypothetical protein